MPQPWPIKTLISTASPTHPGQRGAAEPIRASASHLETHTDLEAQLRRGKGPRAEVGHLDGTSRREFKRPTKAGYRKRTAVMSWEALNLAVPEVSHCVFQ